MPVPLSVARPAVASAGIRSTSTTRGRFRRGDDRASVRIDALRKIISCTRERMILPMSTNSTQAAYMNEVAGHLETARKVV